MGRACKCQIDGKKLNTDTAYKVIKNNKNLYYCNKEEYIEWLRENQTKESEKQEINLIIGELLDGIKTSYLYMKLAELQKQYSNTLILSYLTNNKDFLNKIMNKQFINSAAKIGYLMAVISNNLADYEIPIQEDIRHIEYEIVETKYKARKTRRSLLEIEREVLEDIE